MDKPQKKERFAVGGKNGGFFAEGEIFLGGFAVGEKNLLSSPDLGGPSMVGGGGGVVWRGQIPTSNGCTQPRSRMIYDSLVQN